MEKKRRKQLNDEIK